jgi:hypothetical protein
MESSPTQALNVCGHFSFHFVLVCIVAQKPYILQHVNTFCGHSGLTIVLIMHICMLSVFFNVMHPTVLCKTTRKYFVTVNRTFIG